MITRDELRALVRAKLIENGSAPDLADWIVSPGFFVSDEGLPNLARALGVLGPDEEVAS